jgi:hypothetical protein
MLLKIQRHSNKQKMNRRKKKQKLKTQVAKACKCLNQKKIKTQH